MLLSATIYSMRNYPVLKLVFILTPFVFSFAFGLDIYIPIIPQMTEVFNTTPAMIQLTMSLFLLTTGVGQLFIGPLADRYGRRMIFFWASSCFILGALICAMSNHIGVLIAARVFTSLGACGMFVGAFAVVRDLFSSNQSARMYSFLNGAIGISPTFAPILGGYLALYFGWQSVFYFLAGIGLLALFFSKQYIEETLEQEARVEIDRKIFRRYWTIFSHPQFRIFSTLTGVAEGVFFCFFSISPFIIINELGVPMHQFGYYFAVFGAVIAFAGLGSGKLIERMGISATLVLGICLMFVGGCAMLTCWYVAGLSLSGFLIPMVLACTGAMFLLGGSASRALEPFEAIAGTAAAAFGATQFAISAAIGFTLMLFPTDTTVPYGMFIIVSSLASVVLFLAKPAVQPIRQKVAAQWVKLQD